MTRWEVRIFFAGVDIFSAIWMPDLCESSRRLKYTKKSKCCESWFQLLVTSEIRVGIRNYLEMPQSRPYIVRDRTAMGGGCEHPVRRIKLQRQSIGSFCTLISALRFLECSSSGHSTPSLQRFKINSSPNQVSSILFALIPFDER